MPLIKLQVSTPIADDQKQVILKSCSEIVAEVTGKPEAYVMALLEKAEACMAGEVGPAAFADVRGIGGLGGQINIGITARLCDLLQQELDIPADRVYVNFTDVPAGDWGWNKATFG